MPFPCVLRIWDFVLSRGYNAVFLCALSLMKINESLHFALFFESFVTDFNRENFANGFRWFHEVGKVAE